MGGRLCFLSIAAILLSGCARPLVGGSLVAVPSMTAQLPDGTLVMALIILPRENVLNKNADWVQWEQDWPTHHELMTRRVP